ncbi:ATP-binding protein [Streptomyces sp. TRM 70351]|uniref:ATP-binding protein n=1 Tax=Streptomyces sp. TRM 70351 TaxID=3116552 RepID=UPI003FCDC5AC
MAQGVPTFSTMAVPHGPVGVGQARRRMRAELRGCGVPDAVVDDAVLVLSELLSNAYRHAQPLPPDDSVRADWARDPSGEVTIAVTDGGGPTRPLPSTPSVTARGGRGLSIITSLARAWGVRENAEHHEVTVWAVVEEQKGYDGAKGTTPAYALRGMDLLDALDGLEGLDGLDGLGVEL